MREAIGKSVSLAPDPRLFASIKQSGYDCDYRLRHGQLAQRFQGL
jgi:hypothetical protein